MARAPNRRTLRTWNPSPGGSSSSGDIVVGVIGGLLFILIVPVDQSSGLVGTSVVALIGAAGLRRHGATAPPAHGARVAWPQLWSSDLTLIAAALAGLALTAVAILHDLATSQS